MKSVASVWTRLGEVASLVATPLAPSHYLALVSPLAATHVLQARVEAVWDETADARTLTLRPGRGWRTHKAGQHMQVDVPVDGRVARRTYSIASCPDRRDGCITITVKATPGGRVSPALVRSVKPGDYLGVGLPQGDFVWPEGAPPKALFVTGGSGITPVISILRTLSARRAMPDAVHVHYARTPRDVIFGDELRALAAAHPRYRLVIRHTAQDPRRFSREELDAMVPDWSTREAWACGPAGLLDAVESCFDAAGRGRALHVERFRAKVAPIPANAAGGRVRFGLSRRDVEADGHTPLLRVAEDAGVNAPHGCRMGICRTCDATMVSGCVRDLRTGQTIDEPGARVQVCVCAAAGDVEIAL
jgi:ferredoxin-NADP reductase